LSRLKKSRGRRSSMYRVIFEKNAGQEFLSLERAVQSRVVSVLERANMNPYAYARKLSGTSFYRIRVGDYRVIVHIDEMQKALVVLKVGHRKNIYG
ncbi:MAG: type II toxin-antitoxin system RelE/ParE family toxin, partial [Candidatus Micrarchaeota archaeon]